MMVLSVSDTVEELLGFKPDDFLAGKVSLKNLIHVHDQDIASDLFSTEINKTSGTCNIRLRQANGRIRCIKCQYTKEPDTPGGKPILELRLQDAKSLWQGRVDQAMMVNFNSMMENTDDYIYFKDRNHVFTGASQTLVAITSPSEHWTDLLGLTDYDVFPEEYADIYYRLEKQVFAGVNVAHEIQEIQDADGNKGWVDNRKYPIRNKEGEIIGLFGIARDITERKHSEDAQKKALSLLSAIADRVPGVVYQYRLRPDGSSCFPYSSSAIREIYRVTPEEVREDASKVFAILHPDDFDGVVESIQKSAAELTPWNHEYRVKFEDGTVRWLLGNALPSKEIDGSVLWHGFITDITDRKKIEKSQLEGVEQLRLFRALLDHSYDGIEVIDPVTLRLIDANETTCNVLGYTRAELLTMSVFDIDPDLETITANFLDQLKQSGNVLLESIHKRKDGSKFPVEINVRLVEGDKQYIIAISRDITQRKQDEKGRRESENKYRKLLEGVPDIIYSFSSKRGGLFYSPHVETILGYSVAYLLEHPFHWQELIHPSDEDEVKLSVQNFLSGNSFDIEYRIKDAQGKWHWLRDRSIDKRQEGDEIIIEGIATDITERKQYQEVAEEFFEQPMALHIVCKLDGEIVKANSAWNDILGYEMDKFIGANILDFIHPGDKDKTIAELSSLGQGKRTYFFENRYRDQNGSYTTLRKV